MQKSQRLRGHSVKDSCQTYKCALYVYTSGKRSEDLFYSNCSNALKIVFILPWVFPGVMSLICSSALCVVLLFPLTVDTRK